MNPKAKFMKHVREKRVYDGSNSLEFTRYHCEARASRKYCQVAAHTCVHESCSVTSDDAYTAKQNLFSYCTRRRQLGDKKSGISCVV